MDTILVLHDGKPGHISQSLGLAHAIAANHPAHIALQQVKPRSGPAGRLARLLCRWPLASALARRLLFKLADEQTEHGQALASYPVKPGLIISMGGQVVACNAASARHFKCPNIVIGDRKSVPKSAFTANIRRKGDKHDMRVIGSGITFCKTNTSSSQALSSQAPSFQEQLDPSQRYWCLLVGGKGSGYVYDHNDIRHLFDWLKQQAIDNNIHWLISTSRRTSKKHEQLLRELIEQDPIIKDRVAKTLWVNAGNNEPVMPLLSTAEQLFVTEDSLSMVNEAVATTKPVYTLMPHQANIKSGHRKAMRYLCKQGLIQRIALDNPEPLKPLQVKFSYQAHVSRVLTRLSQLGAFDGLHQPKQENGGPQTYPSNA